MNDAIATILLFCIAISILLMILPVIFPDMIPNNVKKHIQGSVTTGNYNEVPKMSNGY